MFNDDLRNIKTVRVIPRCSFTKTISKNWCIVFKIWFKILLSPRTTNKCRDLGLCYNVKPEIQALMKTS